MEEKAIKHFTDSIYYEVEKTARVLKMLGVQVFQQINSEIEPDEHAALDVISCNPDICQRDLAKLILKDRANTGKILNSLEKKGFISRYIDTKNNRLVKKMRITEQGEKVLNETNAKLQKMFNEQRISCKISLEEVERIQNSLKRLRLSFEEIIDMKI